MSPTSASMCRLARSTRPPSCDCELDAGAVLVESRIGQVPSPLEDQKGLTTCCGLPIRVFGLAADRVRRPVGPVHGSSYRPRACSETTRWASSTARSTRPEPVQAALSEACIRSARLRQVQQKIWFTDIRPNHRNIGDRDIDGRNLAPRDVVRARYYSLSETRFPHCHQAAENDPGRAGTAAWGKPITNLDASRERPCRHLADLPFRPARGPARSSRYFRKSSACPVLRVQPLKRDKKG